MGGYIQQRNYHIIRMPTLFFVQGNPTKVKSYRNAVLNSQPGFLEAHAYIANVTQRDWLEEVWGAMRRRGSRGTSVE